jgi:16S rRNA U1498 N3-methylase RsmE
VTDELAEYLRQDCEQADQDKLPALLDPADLRELLAERAAAKRLREAMTKIAETTRKPGSAGEHTWYATVRKLQEIAREALNPTKP